MFFEDLIDKNKLQRIQDEFCEVTVVFDYLEAATAVVQLLDREEPIENVMGEWMRIVCQFLHMDTAQVFSLEEEEQYMDVSCEWRAEGRELSFEQTTHIAAYSFLRTEKPVVLEGTEKEYKEEMAALGAGASMIFPVLQQENGRRMVLALNHSDSYHFEANEIKFVADAVMVLQSILVKRLQKNSLASSFAALEAVLDNVGSAVGVVDKNTRKLLFANQKLKKNFAEELQDNVFWEFLNQEVLRLEGKQPKEVYYDRRRQWYDLAFKEFSWVDGRSAVLYSLYDITDKKLYQRKIEKQAHTDFLTGLYNRMCCERDLAHLIEDAEVNGGMGALLYMDLDDFKHINDALGHQYGDMLLKTVSHSLQKIEGIENTCYRMGGDEFVILISPQNFQQFDRIVDDVRAVFNRPWLLKDADYYCTMSMGVVTFPDNGNSVVDLIKKADIAMYEAKKGGKNRVSKYSSNVGDSSGRRLDMEKNMRNAAARGCQEFLIYYQPIIDVHKEEIECAGAEALIRWNSSKLGFISPGEFIPLAEYLGLINPIGNYVLQEACRHCKKWNESGYPNYKVNVNLSVVQLLQPDIVDIVARTVKESGINPRNLTLEVTESLAINDMNRMKGILSGIKALGVSLALDDFGTGYSSLNHIREMPFDIIKVDQSFVKELATDAYAKSFVRMVSELAEAVGMNVCVEGIETIHQYAVLEGMKIKYIQGYFFDKPMPREEFEKKYVQ